MPVLSSILGFPRIGARRELKAALEAFWSGRSEAADLGATARGLRAAAWDRQKALGLDILPSADFALYDHVLDTSLMTGAVPEAYRAAGPLDSLETAFAMARGRTGAGVDVPAQEMTKWFDTNYHYLVPEVEPMQHFLLSSTRVVDQYREARALGHDSRPVLLGPVTFLLLAKSAQPGFRPLDLLPALVPVYAEVLTRLAQAGADWVQIDEPALVLDLDAAARAAFAAAYAQLHAAVPGVRLMLATYFGALGDNLETALALPVQGLHVDLVRAPDQLEPLLDRAPRDLLLSLGVVDGRNVWKTDLAAVLDRLEPVAAARPDLVVASSCSLLHVPIDLETETQLPPEVRDMLAFAVQKVGELAVLARALNQGRGAVAADLADNARAVAARRASPLTRDPRVRARLDGVTANWARRVTPFAERIAVQQAALNLPLLPTTTIGSFPQTEEVRKARAAYNRGAMDQAAYDAFLRAETERAIRRQEELGLDVLVHGEFERNDMVQYFGERLSGFAFTRNGWVQSYGSRCVRPPILYGDVARPRPMTVDWWRTAKAMTDRPVKGMLTGPVTILQWSFVRDDQPRADSCRQIALAIRDEAVDLEREGARIVQIDEAALREGLPLRRADRAAYLDWAVLCFRIASCGVRPQTQIHTHMCYSEFNDILAAIAAMDADVLSIEAARSKMELLDAFATVDYPNEIGPGVYDIHSPRIPTVEEMADRLRAAARRVPVERLWVNPDCGLKTRRWEEVMPALANMVAAARLVRARPD